MAYGWTYQKSGLGLREDEFSWQGSAQDDPRFFLRRSKDDPEELTDLLFGQLPDDTVELLLAEFLRATGGISGNRLVFTGIGRRDENHDAIVAIFDRTTKIGTNVAVLVARHVKNSFLDQDGDRWNAVLELQPSAT